MGSIKKRLSVILSVFLLCIASVALSSCLTFGPADSQTQSNQVPTNSMASDETWAIYWYMCGTNLESEYTCATQDLQEAFKASLPNNVEVIIEAGGAASWSNGFDPNVLQIYRYNSDGFVLLETLPQANMGDRATFEAFLNYCNTKHPADKRMLLFWDHGGGSLGGVCNDENYGMDPLSLPEIRAALAATSKTTDGSALYELVGFDACLMATIDTAAIFAPYAHYMVASEEIEPLDGWDYTGVLAAFASNPGINGKDLGFAVCDSFAAFYQKSDSLGDKALYTMSLLDLSQIGPLLEAYNHLGDEALVYASKDQEYLGAYGRAALSADNFANNDSSGYTNMMDLGDFLKKGEAEGLFPQYGASALKALDAVVIHKVQGEAHQRCSGLSCFYNYAGSIQKLQSFLEINTSQVFSYFYEYTQKGSLSKEGIEYVKQASQALLGQIVEQKPLDTIGLESLEGYPLTLGANGQWQLDIAPELSQQLAAVYLSQAWESGGEGSFLALYGLTGYFPHDFTNGVFTANFQNDWYALGELPLYTEPCGSDQLNDYYASPVLINGDDYALLISQEMTTGKLSLLGAVAPIDEKTGMASKEIYQLKKGDKVEAIMSVLLPEGSIDAETGSRLFSMPLGEITFDDNTQPRMRAVSSLDEGDWATFMITFVMVDFAGNTYYSGYGYYQVSGGKIQTIGGW